MDQIRPGSHDNMQVITHDPVPEDVHSEDRSELFESSSNPEFSVGVVSTGLRIIPAQKGSSDAAVDEVKDLHFIGGNDL